MEFTRAIQIYLWSNPSFSKCNSTPLAPSPSYTGWLIPPVSSWTMQNAEFPMTFHFHIHHHHMHNIEGGNRKWDDKSGKRTQHHIICFAVKHWNFFQQLHKDMCTCIIVHHQYNAKCVIKKLCVVYWQLTTLLLNNTRTCVTCTLPPLTGGPCKLS